MQTPTQIINSIRSGNPYSFKGATGKDFKISHTNGNFVMDMPGRNGKKVKRGLNTQALETIIYNSLQNAK